MKDGYPIWVSGLPVTSPEPLRKPYGSRLRGPVTGGILVFGGGVGGGGGAGGVGGVGVTIGTTGLISGTGTRRKEERAMSPYASS